MPEPAAVDPAEAESGGRWSRRRRRATWPSCASSSRPGWRWTRRGAYGWSLKREHTALIKAAIGKQTKMSKFLVTRGADANAKNKRGYTAMMMAAGDGNTELVGYLHENGAEVNALDDDTGGTALIMAAMYGKTATAKFMIEELKADTTLKDNSGRLRPNSPCSATTQSPSPPSTRRRRRKRERSLRRRWRRRRSWT